jgi:hypothetical protein
VTLSGSPLQRPRPQVLRPLTPGSGAFFFFSGFGLFHRVEGDLMLKGHRTPVTDGSMRSIRLAPHVDARVRELAQREGTTVSSILRRAIAEGIGVSGSDDGGVKALRIQQHG